MQGNTHVSLSAISNNSDGPKEEEKQDAHQKKVQKITINKKTKTVVTELKYFGRLNKSRVFSFRDNKTTSPSKREMLPPRLAMSASGAFARPSSSRAKAHSYRHSIRGQAGHP